MNKIILVFSSCILLQSNLFAQFSTTQDSIRFFTDSTFSVLKDYSLYFDKVDLEGEKQQILNNSKNFNNFLELFPILQQIFDKMEDNHSFFWYNDTRYASNFGQLDESKIRLPLIEALESGEGKILAKIIDDVGYVRIPQDNSSDDFQEMQFSAQALHDAICLVNEKKPVGWIFDLRLNTGGNMYPMISGIIPFIGDGIFASKVDRNGVIEHWRIEGKSVFEGNDKITELDSVCLPDLTDSKIVVLTSEITGSSGEIVSLSLLNRKNTWFLGERSAGYMTSNELFRLPFGVFLLLANAYELDTNGKVIERIVPDRIMIKGDNFKVLSEDEKVIEAINWLKLKE